MEMAYENLLSRMLIKVQNIDQIHLLNGYEKEGPLTQVNKNGKDFFIQLYRGEHETEYTLINEKEILHFQNGILQGQWKLQDGKITGSFEVFEGGCAKYSQEWSNLQETSWIRTVNSKSGRIKEIVDPHTQNLVYRGGLDPNGKRRGRGFEFDSTSGELKLEGVWYNNALTRIIRLFEGNTMMEFKDTGNNLEVFTRVPIYVGEYCYNPIHNTCSRHNKGFIINNEGIASSEGQWNEGIEIESVPLSKGWYKVEEDPLAYPIDITTIVIPAYKFKYANCLNLSKYKDVESITIEEFNFCNTDHFSLSGVHKLEKLLIGDHSFYMNDRTNRMNRTFSIVDCNSLRSIIIKPFSFQFYSGEFELCRLPSLELLQIGQSDTSSANFIHSNFVVKGKRRIGSFIYRHATSENDYAGRSCL